MLTVVAPASMAASTTSQRKSISVRAASSGLNSTSSQWPFGAADPGDGALDDLLAGHPELVLAVDGRGGQEHVDARLLGVLDGLPGAVDVAVVAAGEAADGRAGDLGGDGADGLEVALRGDREAGLDDVDAQVGQRPGDLELLGVVHAGAGRLLAVAERGVEDPDPLFVVGHGGPVLSVR